PRFALVLSVLVAGAAIAVLLLTSGSSPSGPGTEPTIGLGASHQCARTRASAQVTAQSAIVITATSRAPLSVTEQATGPNGTASVTRQELVTARVKLSDPVAIKNQAQAEAGACASTRAAALRVAYGLALRAAHATAAKDAESELRALIRRLAPSVLSQAQAKASVRAHRLALAALPAATAQAAAAARRQAGAG
ncbi:MAG: hypothetical protein JO244_10245, partial [Solirubrobacterales bacterium]|nr:hypothetical protein [Solirubrobacterales bacterium]